jgi:Na+-transporting methylmalonyl-CoA/oxaloacetate decarboxylase gamma subunit
MCHSMQSCLTKSYFRHRGTLHLITRVEDYDFGVVLTLCFCFFFAVVFLLIISVRGVRRYQRGNQNPYIEEEQTTQWPKEKVQRDKQRSTKIHIRLNME